MDFIVHNEVVPAVDQIETLRSTRAHQLPANAQPLTGEKKVLIVYLSRTNNTKAIAEFIHQKVGGGMVALELKRLIRL
jgi:hypothetical protein